jgi:hypothetical protein
MGPAIVDGSRSFSHELGMRVKIDKPFASREDSGSLDLFWAAQGGLAVSHPIRRATPPGSEWDVMFEPARYQIRQIQRTTGPYGKALWKITFKLVGKEGETLDVMVRSAIFSTLDLDGEYTAEDLVRLREAGGG